MALVRGKVARWLEAGVLAGSFGARLAARAHAPLASRAVARPLRVSARVAVVTVGGATLGGSGKTRVALACARELADRGARVALVGHAYRAAPGGPRVVCASDALEEVGDEALACARVLASTATPARGVRVIVAPTRQRAVDFAAALEPAVDAIVIDGALQLSPVRSSLSILALDAEAPWGAGELPPAGDLRAPRAALLEHADHVVLVDAAPRRAMLSSPLRAVDLASLAASLAGARVGLFTALARPERLARALARAGLAPCEVVRADDHGPITPTIARELTRARVDVWLASSKCAVHLERVVLGAPLIELDGSVELPPSLVLALGRLRAGLAACQARNRLDCDIERPIRSNPAGGRPPV